MSDFAKAAVISAPPLGLRMPVPDWKLMAAKKVKDLQPYLEMGNEIAPEQLSVEGANVGAYRDDERVHGKISPIAFLSIQAEADEVLGSAADIEIPTALMVGEEDSIVDPETIKKYFESLGTHKKAFFAEGVGHEVLNDLSKKEAWKFTLEWFL